MIDLNRQRFPDGKFRVSLGHASVDVVGQTRQDAVAKARERLSVEMPRLYDVINQAAESRFEVEILEP